MNRLFLAVMMCSLASACSSKSGDEEEAVQGAVENLKYIPSTGGVANGPLTKKSYSETNETNRRTNTTAYYNTVSVSSNGTTSVGTISSALSTLTAFKTNYGFNASEVKTFYYNRGDLGIGREMHCQNNSGTTGQIACYVRNFAAGDDGTEFRFGMSADVAFKNMDNGSPFATVAMVFRNSAPAGQKVFFAVYGADENLTNVAALDRHGYNAFNGHTDDEGTVGTPGVSYNNHIPSNCLNCHGGTYDSSLKSVTGALFLPFDLDQFDFQSVVGKTRADQLTSFQTLNGIASTVAANSGSTVTGGQVVTEVNGWYSSGSFNSAAYVPSGWSTPAQQSVYTSVVRTSCRNCHVTDSPFGFESPSLFISTAVVQDLCQLAMPHALQTMREFWQSSKPAALEAYFRAGSATDIAQANILHDCAPKAVITLDPHRIMATSAVLLQ
ncbi:MAG: hypothetical protein ABW061_28880 [Polyangiaceae bacterium]